MDFHTKEMIGFYTKTGPPRHDDDNIGRKQTDHLRYNMYSSNEDTPSFPPPPRGVHTVNPSLLAQHREHGVPEQERGFLQARAESIVCSSSSKQKG